MNAEWLKAELAKKEVPKRNATWALTDTAYSILAAHVRVGAWRHNNPEEILDGSNVFFDPSGQEAAEVLLDDLRSRLAYSKEALDRWQNETRSDAPVQVKRWSNGIQDYEAAIHIIERLSPQLVPASPPALKASWHSYAGSLSDSFLAQLKRCNRKPPIGLSKDSPVCAFVAAVIPHVTGDEPTLNAVSLFLTKSYTRND